MLRKKLLLFLCIANSYFAFAQTSQDIRIELDAEDFKTNEIIPVGRQGVVLMQENTKRVKGLASWDMTLFNSDLKTTEKKNILLNTKLLLKTYFFDEDMNALYMLFASPGSMQIKSIIKGDFVIYKLSLDNFSLSKISGKTPKAFATGKLIGMDDKIILAGHTTLSVAEHTLRTCISPCCCFLPTLKASSAKKSKSRFYIANFNTGKIEEFEYGQPKHNTGTVDIALHKELQRVSIATLYEGQKRASFLDIHEVNINNPKSTIQNTSISTDKIFKMAKVTRTGNNETMVIGTYLNSAPSLMSSFVMSSNGVFVSKLVNGKQQFIKYYNFTDFTQFHDLINSLVSKWHAKRITKKKENTEKKGGEFNLNYNLLVHDVICINDTYIMVAELYYPEYHTETQYNHDKGKLTTSKHNTTSTYNPAIDKSQQVQVQVFDGYRYTHTIVAGFNGDGDLLWDNSFEIFNILTMNLKHQVQAVAQPDNTLLLTYNWNGYIHTKIIKGGSVISHKQSEPIETSYADDKVKSNREEDVEFWYDNVILAHGIQQIKNKTESKQKNVQKNRKVLYLNKISY